MTSMVASTSQRVDFLRQSSSSTSQARSDATQIGRHRTGAAHMNQPLEKTA